MKSLTTLLQVDDLWFLCRYGFIDGHVVIPGSTIPSLCCEQHRGVHLHIQHLSMTRTASMPQVGPSGLALSLGSFGQPAFSSIAESLNFSGD